MEHRTLLGHLLMTYMAVCLSSSQPTRRSRSSSGDDIVVFPTTNDSRPSLPVFPDEPVVRPTRLTPPADQYGRPLCVRKPGDTFCESVDNYPVHEIRRAMVNYSSEEFMDVFGGAMHVSSRKFGDLDEATVCPQHSRLFYPKAAVNEQDQWAYVVNDVDYVQTVMAEICQGEEDQPCDYLDGRLPSGVSSRCRQKYAYKRMLALHPNKKRTYTDAFRFPSCCVCYVRKPLLMTRSKIHEDKH